MSEQALTSFAATLVNGYPSELGFKFMDVVVWAMKAAFGVVELTNQQRTILAEKVVLAILTKKGVLTTQQLAWLEDELPNCTACLLNVEAGVVTFAEKRCGWWSSCCRRN